MAREPGRARPEPHPHPEDAEQQSRPADKLAPEQRPAARRFGLALACITRILLLLSLAFLHRMFVARDGLPAIANVDMKLTDLRSQSSMLRHSSQGNFISAT